MRNVAKKYPHHQILSFVEIKTSKFLHDVNDALPKKIVCVNTKSVLCDRLQSRLFKVLKCWGVEMSHGLNIMTSVTEKINRIFRSMFEFKLSQTAQTKLKLSNKFNSLSIMAIIHEIGG